MEMHGEHMEAHPSMGRKIDSGDGGVRSYQVPRARQDMHVRADMGGAWRCMGHQQLGIKIFRQIHHAWPIQGSPETFSSP